MNEEALSRKEETERRGGKKHPTIGGSPVKKVLSR